GDQEQLGISEAVEFNTERAPHRAARAVRGDDIAARHRNRTRRRIGGHGRAVLVLPHGRNFVIVADVVSRPPPPPLFPHPRPLSGNAASFHWSHCTREGWLVPPASKERSKVATGPVSRSRNCQVGAFKPTSIMRDTMPNSSSRSSVGGWKVEPRSSITGSPS